MSIPRFRHRGSHGVPECISEHGNGEWVRYKNPLAVVADALASMDGQSVILASECEKQVAEACWVWPGYVNGDGYARKNGVGVHRIMWELLSNEVIPEGMEIDHLCRNRACIRPSHLQVVDHRTNTLRGITIPAHNSRKTECPQGHQYDEVNTYIDKRGKRYCRACKKARDKERRRSHV